MAVAERTPTLPIGRQGRIIADMNKGGEASPGAPGINKYRIRAGPSPVRQSKDAGGLFERDSVAVYCDNSGRLTAFRVPLTHPWVMGRVEERVHALFGWRFR